MPTFLELRKLVIHEIKELVDKHKHAEPEVFKALNIGLEEIASCNTLQETEAYIEDREHLDTYLLVQDREELALDYIKNHCALLMLKRAQFVYQQGFIV